VTVDALRDETTKVVALSWNLFLSWFGDVWHVGHHIAVVGPTGEGKTTFVVPLLKMRKWVLALDPKGEDETLALSGFFRVEKFPLPSRILQDIAEGKPARLIIGGASDSEEADQYLKALMHKAIQMCREQGGWTIYADEFQVLADQRMYGLGKPIERLQITARGKKTSVIAAFQAMAWVPKSATRQATWTVILPTRDFAMIKAVAESMGRDWKDLVRAVKELPSFFMIIIPKSPLAPMVIVHPPKLM
jgi:hypothetical protein